MSRRTGYKWNKRFEQEASWTRERSTERTGCLYFGTLCARRARQLRGGHAVGAGAKLAADTQEKVSPAKIPLGAEP